MLMSCLGGMYAEVLLLLYDKLHTDRMLLRLSWVRRNEVRSSEFTSVKDVHDLRTVQ